MVPFNIRDIIDIFDGEKCMQLRDKPKKMNNLKNLQKLVAI